MGRLMVFLCSGLGVGYLPGAPGTFGTLWGMVLFYLTRNFPQTWFFLGTLVFFALSVLLAHFAEKKLGVHDSSVIIIDEIVGFLVAVLGFSFSWPLAIAAFFVFRLFDVVKPFPVGWVDRKVSGGFGVVFDDVLAGVYTNIVLRLGIFLWEYFKNT